MFSSRAARLQLSWQVIEMCECIVQSGSSKSHLAFLASRHAHSAAENDSSGDSTEEVVAEHLIKPRMRVEAIVNRGGTYECVEVRWGWTPIWSMGTRPPLTQLPLHLVMRSKGFAKLRETGRALIAVQGWYDAAESRNPADSNRSTYTTSRFEGPVFLAALAQVSANGSSCDGLALLTYGEESGKQQLLAFGPEDAAAWLDTGLDWEQARQMADQHALCERQLEHLFKHPRYAHG